MKKEEKLPLNIDALIQPILQSEPQDNWPMRLTNLRLAYPDNAELSYRIAVILEQVSAFLESEQAYIHCLKLAPNNYLIYLYLGHLLENTGNEEMALVCYALCEMLTGNFKQLQLASTTAAQTLERFQQAWQCMERNLAHAKNIETARWVQYSSKPFETAQAPHLFYVPELNAMPIWQPESLDWVQNFKASIPEIINEFYRNFDTAAAHLTPYLSGKEYENTFPALANKDTWQALSIFKDGVEDTSVSKHFPVLLNALKGVPCYGLTDSPYEVFFSKLAKGQTIPPHYGLSNHSLTVHLAIDIPSNCYLEVNGERTLWQESKLTIFDDSYLHMAHNGGDRDRVVLIFAIWHPNLTLSHRQAIQSEFNYRQEWIDGLRENLIKYTNQSQES